MKTTIYLDVDGVLNAVSKKGPALHMTGWSQWETKPVNGWPILYSPEMVNAINELAAHEDITFKWLTTWTDDAAEILSPAIGIDGHSWGVLHGEQHAWGGKAGWWKLDAIRDDWEDSTADRFIWIDDDISAERAALEWVADKPEVLIISPNLYHGLTAKHVAAIRDFAGVTGGSRAANGAGVAPVDIETKPGPQKGTQQ